jgi:hypothetical protein
VPVISPLWTTTVRNYWPLIGALLIFVVLSISDQVWFRPMARRYEAAVKQATELGLSVDANNIPPVLPPRLFSVLTDNSLTAAAAQDQGNSGVLTAQLMEEITALASRHGMRIVSTEPGTVSQQPQAVQVRAHLRLRCRYGQLLTLLDDLAQTGKLIAIDRFTLAGDSGGEILDLWVSRYVIKQSKARK